LRKDNNKYGKSNVKPTLGSESKERNATTTPSLPEKDPQKNRIRSTDYRSWDRLDVDAELDKLEKEGIAMLPAKKSSNLSTIPVVKTSVSMDIKIPTVKHPSQMEFLADTEKNKGNDAFKAGEYEDAVAYYTRSLKVLERAHVYTNRAAAFLRLKMYERAELDSSGDFYILFIVSCIMQKG
jgi:tetratricopeptide (TPR) repeat protein